ncbi:MAG: HAD family phosphatase [Nitriliruptoraceae bacterium]
MGEHPADDQRRGIPAGPGRPNTGTPPRPPTTPPRLPTTPPRLPTTPPRLPAVLIDLDGTLVDTTGLWQVVYGALADHLDVRLAEGWWEQVVGRSVAASLSVITGTGELTGQTQAELERWLVDRAVQQLRSHSDDTPTARVRWRPGAASLLDRLAESGIPTAVVTTTPRRVLDAIIDRLGIRTDTSVAGDEVAEGKPDPQGYLDAAALLGVDSSACVAIEDSPTGVAAAEAAGARVLVVPHTAEVPARPDRRVVASLVEVDLDLLAALPARA